MVRTKFVALVTVALAAVLLIADPAESASSAKPQIVPLTPHGDEINYLQLSLDDRLVVTAARDATVKIWDMQSGRLIRTFNRSTAGYNKSFDIAPSGKILVGMDDGDLLKVWDLESEQQLRVFPKPESEITLLRITPDGQQIISAHTNGRLTLWDIRSGSSKATSGGPRPRVYNLVVLPANKGVLVGHENGVVEHWDLNVGRRLRSYKVHDSAILNIAATPDGGSFISRADGRLKVWDLKTGRLVKTIENVAFGRSGMVVGLQGNQIFTNWEKDGHDGEIEIRDMKSGKVVHTLKVGFSRGRTFALTSDGAQLVHGGGDGTISVWNLADGKMIRRIGGDYSEVGPTIISHDGRSMISVSGTGIVQFWSLETGELTRTFDAKAAAPTSVGAVLAITADGRFLATGGSTRNPALWDTATGRLVRMLGEPIPNRPGTTTRMNALVFTRDGRYAVSAAQEQSAESGGLNPGTQAVHQWELGTGRLVRTFEHPKAVNALAVSTDGRHMVSVAEDATIRLWDVGSASVLRIRGGFGCGFPYCRISISDAGQIIQAVSEGARFVVLDTLEPVREIPMGEMGVGRLAVTDDGRWGARVGFSGVWKVELWDLQSGKLVRSFGGLPASPRVNVGDVAISADGQRIIVAGTGGH